MSSQPVSESYPVLIGQSGPLNGSRWVIRESIVIGRGDDCDIIIPDRKISRQHARLQPSSQGIVLEDLDSKNGTHYNGSPLKGSVTLVDGDIIQIALAQKFTFLSSDATIPLEFDAPLEAMLDKRKIRVEKRSRRAWVNEKEIGPPLSMSQFTLLEMLYLRDGLVVPREEVVKKVWGEDQSYGISDQALDALVRRLRDRVAELDPSHEYIITMRGHGLRLDNPIVE
jgi:hypothetical protein